MRFKLNGIVSHGQRVIKCSAVSLLMEDGRSGQCPTAGQLSPMGQPPLAVPKLPEDGPFQHGAPLRRLLRPIGPDKTRGENGVGAVYHGQVERKVPSQRQEAVGTGYCPRLGEAIRMDG